MNKETRLILENQCAIMDALVGKLNNKLLDKQYLRTQEALNQEESNTEENIKGALDK